jgi:hypothetical protein
VPRGFDPVMDAEEDAARQGAHRGGRMMKTVVSGDAASRLCAYRVGIRRGFLSLNDLRAYGEELMKKKPKGKGSKKGGY